MQSDTAFFKGLGRRIKHLREKAGYSQEDMVAQGFSLRYWQRIEAGKPITLRTLLRICRLFSVAVEEIVRETRVPDNGKQVSKHSVQPHSKKAKK